MTCLKLYTPNSASQTHTKPFYVVQRINVDRNIYAIDEAKTIKKNNKKNEIFISYSFFHISIFKMIRLS